MDFNRLAETLYEWEDVIVYTYGSHFALSNDHKIIGKVDVYEYGIEIMFNDGTALWFGKNNVMDIQFEEFNIKVVFDNGDSINLECD